MEPVVVALDFETADNGADAACALGMARVRGSRVEDVFYRLIRPPRRRGKIACNFLPFLL